MKPLCSIIIVHWNNHKLLKNELKLIGRSKNLEVIVVDNASDKKPDWVKKEFPDVKILLNSKNEGYARACNRGAKKSRGEWLLFLNDDLEILSGQVKSIISYANENHLDAASPESSAPGYKKPLPTTFSLLAEFTPLKYLIPLNRFKSTTLFGGCLLIKRNAFLKLGGWEENFFFWFDDADLTYRLVENGFKIGWIPLKVKHIGGHSLKRYSDKEQKKLYFSSMRLYAKKHFSFFGRFIVWLITNRYTLF